MRMHNLATFWLVAALVPACPCAAELSTTVAAMAKPTDINLIKGTPQVVEGPGGGKALLFDKPFEGRIDLKSHDVDPKACDLIKLQVKADRGAFVRIAVENYPERGDLSYWYVLDTMRGAFDWKTIFVDLKKPEEIKRAGGRRNPWRKGMGKGTADACGIQISGQVKDLKSKAQGTQRRIWLGPVRCVKEAIHLDWDQTQAPCTWGKGKNLVYAYPLTLTNRLQNPVTAILQLKAFDAPTAKAALAESSVKLAPTETKTVEAKLTLPAAIAAKKPPLYCERFVVFARAQGIDDSEVTILRSSDPIHLTVTVPMPDEALAFPLFPPPSKLPAEVLQFDDGMARQNAEARAPKALIDEAMQHGLYQYGKDGHPTGQFRKTLTAAAYLFDRTGNEKYKAIAIELLKALPSIWAKWYKEYEKQPVREISSGIVSRWGERNHYVLGLGWLVMGTQRSPYLYGKTGNGKGGSMSSLAYAFDIMTTSLTPEDRGAILNGFFLPAGLQCRNHYIGDGNQQATANVTALYAGLATRNWPLVAFVTSSEHGLDAIFTWCFDDEGVQIRKRYQTYTLRPLLWTLELLNRGRLAPYDKYRARLTQTVNAKPQDKDMGKPFEDRYFWEFVKQRRLK